MTLLLLAAALEPGDVRGILLSVVAVVVGLVAVVAGARLLRTWTAGGPDHRAWPAVEGVVVGSTTRPVPFTGDHRVTEGARYHVVRHRDRDGVERKTAVPPSVRMPRRSGSTVRVHVDPTGESTPVAAHSLVPRAVALLVVGVLCLGGVLVGWLR